MPVAGGPRLREQMGPVFQLYCPACKRARDPPSFSAKKTRACQTCGHENIIICFTGVNHPPGYVKRTKQRRTIAIVFLFVAMLVPMIMEVAVWGSKGIWPFPKDPTPAELQVQRDAMVTLLVTGLLGGVAGLFFIQFYAWGPENRALDHFLEQIIQQHMPADLDHLPVVKGKNFPQYIGWLRNPIGLRYVEMVKNFKPEMKFTP